MLVLFGRGWVRFTRFGPEESAYAQVMEWFLAWPDWLPRAAGLLEAGTALKLFEQWRLDEQPSTAAG